MLLHELAVLQSGDIVIGALHRAFRQFDFLAVHLFPRDQFEDVADAVEPGSFLVDGMEDVPWRQFAVGAIEHEIARAGILEPLAARREVHRTEFPLTERIVDSRLEPAFLLFIADLEPDFNELDAGIDDVLLHFGAELEEALVSFLEQNPMTYSTPARLYQLRSKIRSSPAAGKCCM